LTEGAPELQAEIRYQFGLFCSGADEEVSGGKQRAIRAVRTGDGSLGPRNGNVHRLRPGASKASKETLVLLMGLQGRCGGLERLEWPRVLKHSQALESVGKQL
jgi:hypothetical protein